MSYKYSIEQCDVHDRAACEVYRSKRSEWIGLLSGEDPQSIFSQLGSLFWYHALFAVVNHLRKLSRENPTDTVGFNGPTAMLFDTGYVAIQALGVRRLTERPASSPERAVVSLPTIVKDLKDNHRLLTRENYVSHDGIPYDYEHIKTAFLHSQPSCGPIPRVGTLDTTGPMAWSTSERMHKSFDRLSEKSPTCRSRNDVVDISLFDRALAHLKVCEDVKVHVDKFIAHSADSYSKTRISDAQAGLTLEQLDGCHKAIMHVAHFLLGPVLWGGYFVPMPYPQGNHLSNFDKSWVDPSRIDEVTVAWHRLTEKVKAWEREDYWPQ